MFNAIWAKWVEWLFNVPLKERKTAFKHFQIILLTISNLFAKKSHWAISFNTLQPKYISFDANLQVD